MGPRLVGWRHSGAIAAAQQPTQGHAVADALLYKRAVLLALLAARIEATKQVTWGWLLAWAAPLLTL